MRLPIAMLVALVLGGCASKVPVAIREPVAGGPSLAQVRSEPAAFIGREVRWGGTIAAVANRPDTTRIEVVARELGGNGRPQESDRSAGRFLLQVEGFLDPAVYSEGREVTARGVLAEPVAGRIGEHPYRFPLVKARTLYLWPPRVEPRYDRHPPPWYYDPWYPRFHPYGYPYW